VAIVVAYFLFRGYINPLLVGWPTTADAAAAEALGWLSPEQRDELRFTRREDLYEYHFSLGMAIRNDFGLWGNNWLLLESACDTQCQPDEASMEIMERMWEKLQSPPPSR
jgi:hypothetical protein